MLGLDQKASRGRKSTLLGRIGTDPPNHRVQHFRSAHGSGDGLGLLAGKNDHANHRDLSRCSPVGLFSWRPGHLFGSPPTRPTTMTSATSWPSLCALPWLPTKPRRSPHLSTRRLRRAQLHRGGRLRYGGLHPRGCHVGANAARGRGWSKRKANDQSLGEPRRPSLNLRSPCAGPRVNHLHDAGASVFLQRCRCTTMLDQPVIYGGILLTVQSTPKPANPSTARTLYRPAALAAGCKHATDLDAEALFNLVCAPR